MRHVITLSSIPPRFGAIGPSLQSLLRQKARPEAIELHIPRSYRRFPDWGGALPDVPEGVTIVRVDEDLGPATKILPAARARRGQDIELIYVDDDRIYGPDWTRRCLALRAQHPRSAICGAGFTLEERYGLTVPARALPVTRKAPERREQVGFLFRQLWRRAFGPRREGPRLSTPYVRFADSGHVDIAEGMGGVMVRPDFFDEESFVIPPVVWAVDDVWLSGCLERQGIPIWADRSLFEAAILIDASLTEPLYRAVVEGAGRHDANLACVDHMRKVYGIWGGAGLPSA